MRTSSVGSAQAAFPTVTERRQDRYANSSRTLPLRGYLAVRYSMQIGHGGGRVADTCSGRGEESW